MTLDKIIINLSDKEFASGLTYTAVTRVRRAADMAFSPYPDFYRYQLALKLAASNMYVFFFRFAKIFQSKAFKERIAEEDRKKDLCDKREN